MSAHGDILRAGLAASDLDAIVSVINNVYGDGTTVELDRECARRILDVLRDRGWAQARDVAIVVAAAGGTVDVPAALVADPPCMIEQVDGGLLGDLSIAYRLVTR